MTATHPMAAAKMIEKLGGWTAWYHGCMIINRKTRAVVNYPTREAAEAAAVKAAVAWDKKIAAR